VSFATIISLKIGSKTPKWTDIKVFIPILGGLLTIYLIIGKNTKKYKVSATNEIYFLSVYLHMDDK
jgi:hypothetical protein